MTGPSPTIRRAVPGDAAWMADVHGRARATYYRGVVPDEELDSAADAARRRAVYAQRVEQADRVVLVAALDGRPAGFALLGPPLDPSFDDAAVGQLYQLNVEPDRWSRGVGSALHAACVEDWQARSVVEGHLEVWERNERGRAFWWRHGWRTDGHERPGPGDHAFVRMRLAVLD